MTTEEKLHSDAVNYVALLFQRFDPFRMAIFHGNLLCRFSFIIFGVHVGAMSDQKKEAPLPKTSTDTELSDQDLAGVTGGAGDDHLLTLDDIQGESKDRAPIRDSFRKP